MCVCVGIAVTTLYKFPRYIWDSNGKSRLCARRSLGLEERGLDGLRLSVHSVVLMVCLAGSGVCGSIDDRRRQWVEEIRVCK